MGYIELIHGELSDQGWNLTAQPLLTCYYYNYYYYYLVPFGGSSYGNYALFFVFFFFILIGICLVSFLFLQWFRLFRIPLPAGLFRPTLWACRLKPTTLKFSARSSEKREREDTEIFKPNNECFCILLKGAYNQRAGCSWVYIRMFVSLETEAVISKFCLFLFCCHTWAWNHKPSAF